VSGALAEAVEARGARRREDVLRVAAWRLDAGADVRGDLMLAGAADALGRQDFGLAERLARAAATAGAGFDAAFLAAQALHFQGRETDAEAELAALAGQAQDDAQRALVALTRMDICVYGQGRPEEALRIAEAVDAQLSERRWRHEIAVRRGGILNHTAGPSAAVEALAEVRRDAEGGAYIRACLLQSLVLIRMGRLTEGLEAAADAHAAHLTYTGPPLQWPPAFAAVLGTFAFLEGGPLQEAERRSVSGYGDAIAESSVTMQAWCGLLLARTRLARGRVQTAARQAREAVGLLRQVSAPVAGFALGCLAEALALSGRRQEAIAVVAELEGISVPSRHPMGLDLLRARAWVAASAPGDLSEARQLLERTAAVSEETGDLALRVGALHDLARLGRPKEVLGRLVSAAAGMEGELPAARAAHAGALTSADGPGLEQVSITFETLGADLLAAEAAADAAVAWRRAGDPRRAAAAGRRAHDLAARCEGARTPALTAITARAELTGRELEIARLAAAGVPNKEIAARLHLSLHTVQNKLHTAYEKLGVEGRAELAEALEGW
jgi:ATP/maltotriose-dependent transcriptional regulator MalT